MHWNSPLGVQGWSLLQHVISYPHPCLSVGSSSGQKTKFGSSKLYRESGGYTYSSTLFCSNTFVKDCCSQPIWDACTADKCIMLKKVFTESLCLQHVAHLQGPLPSPIVLLEKLHTSTCILYTSCKRHTCRDSYFSLLYINRWPPLVYILCGFTVLKN